MVIYAKVGTGPGLIYKALRKKKAPIVGDKLTLRGYHEFAWEDEHVLVREVRAVGGRNLYVVERW